MNCGEFRSMAESYAAGELPVDTAHTVISHLERCAECRAELEARLALRQTLRRAFTASPELAPSDQFVSAVRARMAQRPSAARGLKAVAPWLGIAAAIVLIVLSSWRAVRPDEGPAVAPQTIALAGEAAVDHRDCALDHALKEPVISLQEAAQRYQGTYAGLPAAVERSPPVQAGTLAVVGAHWCVLNGRHFAHIVAQRAGHIVSVLLTPVARADDEQNPPAECPESSGFQVACFSARGHAIFVVSDLTTSENLEIARGLAPVLQEHLLST